MRNKSLICNQDNITNAPFVMRRIINGAFTVFLGNTGIVISTIIFTPILVRVIGRTSYGMYASVIAAYSIARALSILGLNDSVRKHIAQYKNNENSRTEISSFSILLTIILGLVCSLIGVGIIIYLLTNGKINSNLARYLLIVTVTIIFSNLFNIFCAILYGIYKEKNAAIVAILNKIGFFIFALMLASIGMDLTGVFLGVLLGTIIATVYSLICLRNELCLSLVAAINGWRKYAKDILFFGILTLVGILCYELLIQADILMVGFFRGSDEASAYKAARVIAEMIWFISIPIQTVLLQNASELWQHKQKPELIKIGQKLWKHNFLMLTLLGVGIWVMAEPFVTFYFGSEFSDVVIPLRVLIVGTFFLGLCQIMSPIILGSGWIGAQTIVAIIVTVLNIILNLILIPKFGAKGAAMATSIAYIILFGCYVHLLKLRKLVLITRLIVLKGTVLTVFFGGSLYMLYSICPFSGLEVLLLIAFVGLMIFIMYALILRLISLEEIASYCKQVIHKHKIF
jgi:O-antigen/teichoic acid export membrane protein